MATRWGIFVVFLMMTLAAIEGLQTALDCWGNWCRWPLQCLYQFPLVYVWPSGEGIFKVFFRDAKVLSHYIISLAFMNKGHNVEGVKLESKPRTSLG